MASTPTESGADQSIAFTWYPPPKPKHILDMPPEIFVLLKRYINDEDLILLAATCRVLRHICHPDPGQRKHILSQLTNIRHNRFTTTLSRGSYTYWSCYQCRRLHRIFEMDLPGCPPHITWRRACCYKTNPLDWTNSKSIPLTPMEHSDLAFHHVQIALRFARLGMERVRDDQVWLREVPEPLRVKGQAHTLSAMDIRNRIMQPRSTTITHQTPGYAHKFLIKQHFERRIIEDRTANCPITSLPQLRFVQRTQVEITRHEGSGFPWANALYKICPHVNISNRHTFERPRTMAGGRLLSSPVPSLSHLFGFGLENVVHGHLARSISSHWSVISKNTWGNCKYCLTDFQITCSEDQPNKLSLYIWQDFGTETSFCDADEWENQKSYFRTRTRYPSLYFPSWQPGWSGLYYIFRSHNCGAIARFYNTLDQIPPQMVPAPIAPPTPAQLQLRLRLRKQAASSGSGTQQAIAVVHRPSTSSSSASQARSREHIQDLLSQQNMETGVETMPGSGTLSFTMSLGAGVVRMLINKWRGD